MRNPLQPYGKALSLIDISYFDLSSISITRHRNPSIRETKPMAWKKHGKNKVRRQTPDPSSSRETLHDQRSPKNWRLCREKGAPSSHPYRKSQEIPSLLRRTPSRREGHAQHSSLNHVTSICKRLGFAFSPFGRWTIKTPSLNWADTFSSSASAGMEKLRSKLP